MSAGNKIVNVRFDDGLYHRIEEEVARRNSGTRGVVWTLSDYVRNAVMEKIAHSDRARVQKRIRKFVCEQCDQKFDHKHIGYIVKPLFGKTEYTCVYCIRVRPTGI